MSKLKPITETNFCVLGASGFIGTNLLLRLSEVAKSVKAVSRSVCPAHLIHSKLVWFSQDIEDLSGLAPILRGSDVVIHLVSSSNPGSDSRLTQLACREDELTTLNILNLCVDSGIEKFVFLSSGGSVYGNSETIPTPETASTSPLSMYAKNKLSIEKTLAVCKREKGLDYVAIRASNPYGPYQIGRNKQGIIGSALMAGLRGMPFEIWGDGSIERDFIYIDDLVEGILKATYSLSSFSEFNIGSGEGLSINAVLDLCDAVLGSPIMRVYKEGRASDVQRSILDIDRATTVLDWELKTDIKAGVRQTKLWLEVNRELWD